MLGYRFEYAMVTSDNGQRSAIDMDQKRAYILGYRYEYAKVTSDNGQQSAKDAPKKASLRGYRFELPCRFPLAFDPWPPSSHSSSSPSARFLPLRKSLTDQLTKRRVDAYSI